jgi:hypothetical protein
LTITFKYLAWLWLLVIVSLALFSSSCAVMKNQDIHNDSLHPKSKLDIISKELQSFAEKHKTIVRIPVTGSTLHKEPPPNQREVSWMDASIAKAVLIVHFESIEGKDPDAWNIILLAWLRDAKTFEKPMWTKEIATRITLDSLKNNIHGFLNKADDILAKIKIEDLK